ncbi:ubiquinol oxidase subunit II [Candidatus Riesia pediculischaeffi]|uniref:Ubiquinol oxidase subunit 2 n=2 Tax=Candidatus Riesia pediculischaeffi TaxID=428411 RepID=A0A1V0HKQ1_9ENTR|nr:ubiquinol oxidase subunit II [Candidatus Riesia pediculischaeffi]ARC53405.1 ubiquinol oxidase subunit II [Candidatus Riesia pediculischaeffi]KIE63914.1 Cytochrome O ubiquinol oxidase subunit II [Candidatus Riesia pediculischaeffi PTSU]
MKNSNFKNKKSFLFFITLISTIFLSGCSSTIMHPKGKICEEQKIIILSSIILMSVVVIPVIFMTIFFSIKYRENNKHSIYLPNWSFSKRIELFCWIFPIFIVLILSILAWKTTHQLDPYKKIDSLEKKIVIQAISTDWRWIFIYPEHKIATINEIHIPAHVPIEFNLTSHSVMNSFFIPSLGGQIYAMNGMRTKINLISDSVGITEGFSSSYSGSGFSDMKFKVVIDSRSDFDRWVNIVQKSKKQMKSFRDFQEVSLPSTKEPIIYFSEVSPKLYDQIVSRN